MAPMVRYLELIRVPGVAPLLVASGTVRLSYGMSLLGLILLLRDAGFSYAEVGVVTGVSGLALGTAAPWLGRLVDRVGQTRVLVAGATVAFAAGAGILAAAVSGAGVLPLVALGLVSGAATPPVSPCMRTLWPRLVERNRLDTAYAFDAVQLELYFILGPLLAAGIAATVSAEAAYATTFTLQTAGALGFAAAPASREWRPTPPSDDASRAGAMSTPGMRTLFGALALGAFALGVLEIGIPAFAEREASRADSGWLFALWGVGSMAGGLWYGARHWQTPADRRFLVAAGVLAASLAPLPLAGSMPVFALLVVIAGLALAPVAAVAYSLIAELAPPGSLTEAYAWQVVAFVAGSALGAWLSGAVVDALSVEAALACAPLAAGAGLLVALARRRSLAPRQPV
jgi:MFS family permease